MNEDTRAAIRSILKEAVTCELHFQGRSHGNEGERRGLALEPGNYDFYGTRNWEPGNRYCDIDWSATFTHPQKVRQVRVSYAQRQVSVMVLVNVNRSMDFGSVRVTKRVRAAELLASLIFSAAETHDPVQVVLVSANRIQPIRQRTPAREALIPELVSLLELAPPEPSVDRNRWSLALSLLRRRAHSPTPEAATTSAVRKALSLLPRTSRCLVYIISDFLDFREGDLSAIKSAKARGHELTCFKILDPREEALPERDYVWYTLDDGQASQDLFLTPSLRASYQMTFRSHLEELAESLRSAHCPLHIARTSDTRRDTLALFQKLSSRWRRR